MAIRKNFRNLLTGVALAWAALPALAQDTPVGLWKTIHDDGKTVKTLIRISESGGVLRGTIEKLLDPDHHPGHSPQRRRHHAVERRGCAGT